MKEKRFCPKCKSENVIWKDNNIYGTTGVWVCLDCGFYNQIFPIKEKLNSLMKIKKWKKQNYQRLHGF